VQVSHRLIEGGQMMSFALARAWVRVASAVVAVGLGAVLLVACGSSAAPAGSSALNVGTTVFSLAAAQRVPPVAGKLVGGGKLSLEAYRGHVVVVNFWASWCTVCRQEAAALGAVARQFQGSGVRFVGVDVGDAAASAEAFMRNFRIRYPSLFDPGAQIPLLFNRLIPVASLPSTLVISPGGRIRGRIIGAVSARNLAKLIKVAEARPE
jgi:thiol-disulfide isomerase/thioredoxin